MDARLYLKLDNWVQCYAKVSMMQLTHTKVASRSRDPLGLKSLLMYNVLSDTNARQSGQKASWDQSQHQINAVGFILNCVQANDLG